MLILTFLSFAGADQEGAVPATVRCGPQVCGFRGRGHCPEASFPHAVHGGGGALRWGARRQGVDGVLRCLYLSLSLSISLFLDVREVTVCVEMSLSLWVGESGGGGGGGGGGLVGWLVYEGVDVV